MTSKRTSGPSTHLRIEERRKTVMALPYVISVGLGGSEANEKIVVMVTHRDAEIDKAIESILGDVRLEICETARFHPH